MILRNILLQCFKIARQLSFTYFLYLILNWSRFLNFIQLFAMDYLLAIKQNFRFDITNGFVKFMFPFVMHCSKTRTKLINSTQINLKHFIFIYILNIWYLSFDRLMALPAFANCQRVNLFYEPNRPYILVALFWNKQSYVYRWIKFWPYRVVQILIVSGRTSFEICSDWQSKQFWNYGIAFQTNATL